jgi:hypothetical protein
VSKANPNETGNEGRIDWDLSCSFLVILLASWWGSLRSSQPVRADNGEHSIFDLRLATNKRSRDICFYEMKATRKNKMPLKLI